MKKKKIIDRNTIFNPLSLKKIGELEGNDWLLNQIDNYDKGSFLNAFSIYEKEKTFAHELDILTYILGKSEYLLLGNGDIVIKENHHDIEKAKELGFRVL